MYPPLRIKENMRSTVPLRISSHRR